MDVGESFGRVLKQERKNLGISQEELAERAGVSVRAISFYECNRRSPSLCMVFVIANALQMRPSVFISLIESSVDSDLNPEFRDPVE